ncbi:MAG: universal stress protein [Thermodesulfobacteriota bacterium]|nr:universal stress protein [Thermodesulfobacteriota bacterium]
MFKKILYPTDFSDVSKKAIDYIKQLRERGSEMVIVMHVINQRGMRAIEQYASGNSMEIEQRIMDDAKQQIKVIEDELKKSGFKVKSMIKTGIPVREILKAEEKEENVSVIVIGSHGRGNLEEIFLGSVSEKVSRRCKSPVLIVKR